MEGRRVLDPGLGRVPVPEEINARERAVRLERRRDLIPDHVASRHAVDEDEARATTTLQGVQDGVPERLWTLLTRTINHRKTLVGPTQGGAGQRSNSPGLQKPTDRVSGPGPISTAELL